MVHRFTLALCFIALPVLAGAQPVSSDFQDISGAKTGTVAVTSLKSGVLLSVALQGMPPSSWLAIHVHETGSCDPSSGHESAGGHFNPSGVEHGWLSATGPHAGDLPNIYSDAQGNVNAELTSPLLTWEAGEASIQGRAVIIHAKADDYKSQPSGNAGDRLACAVIAPTQ